MLASSALTDPTIGFISVADLGGGTLIGGYLILNALGRPLEFHCTEPVKPNRAQQILYGATLDAYLQGEQIGQALVGHSELKPPLLVTDRRAVMTLRRFVDIPVVWLDSAAQATTGFRPLSLGANEVFVSELHEQDLATVQRLYDQLSPEWNLNEPFERIHEAITELQKAA